MRNASLGAYSILLFTTGLGVHAKTVLDFETLPAGTVAANSTYRTTVPTTAIITNQYAALGVVMSGVAVTTLGTSAAPSGTNTITGVNSQGKWDWATPLIFTFVSTIDGVTPDTMTSFSITPDKSNASENSAVAMAFDLNDNLLGFFQYKESVAGSSSVQTLSLSNIGNIHKVIVAPTLSNTNTGWGGIAFDLVTFDNGTSQTPQITNNVLDFESPLPAGLTAPTSFTFKQPAPASAIVSDQYAALGILISGAAIQELGTYDSSGSNAAPSGTHTITGVNAQGNWDWATPLVFTFVSTNSSAVEATTTYFSITPDKSNISDNSALVTAYDLDGMVLGSVQYQETRAGSSSLHPLILSNIGQIHRVVVAPSLADTTTGWGGISFDLVTFAPVTASQRPSLSMRFSQVELSFGSQTNLNYQIQYSSLATTNQWENLKQTMTGTGGLIKMTDDITNAMRFYRVILVP